MTTPRRNIEIKARLASLDTGRRAAGQLAAEYLGIFCQIDTFFHCSRGRLKLREVEGRPAELIAYARPDQAEPKPSQYYLVPVQEAATVKSALAGSLGVDCVVRKRREVYLLDDIRIHLDEVEGLGHFLELEAVISGPAGDRHGLERIDNLMRHFDILPEDLLACAYADMLSPGCRGELPEATAPAKLRLRWPTATVTRPNSTRSSNSGERKAMSEVATLKYNGRDIELPVLVGTEDERGVDIARLRADTGLVTLDPGYVNTGSTTSEITFLDGEQGILRYRGYPIEVVAEHCDYIETSYLLIYGELPNRTQLEEFRTAIRRHTLLHEDMRAFYNGFPRDAHPMAILSSVVSALSTFYQDSLDPSDTQQVEISIKRLIAKLPTIAAWSYKKSFGQPFSYPQNDLNFCENFLQMMFSVPSEPYEIDPDAVDALNLLLIVHADHEQNCSTSTVRMVGSADANLFASIAAGICALWGPLHGGANEACVQMLERIREDGGNVKKYVDMAKDKDNNFRLMGFGHRVYKNFDPRATIIKAACDRLLEKMHIKDPLFEIAQELADVALSDDYFVERKLYPNVDFYSGVIYRALGIPEQMFTVLFAIGRLPGWIAHWVEMHRSPDKRICRPRQIYTGPAKREFIPLDQRG